MLLMFGGRRERKKASTEHPFGYGREKYIYAFVVAIVIFSLGGLFALNEAIEKLQHPHEMDLHWAWVPVAVLIGSIALEGNPTAPAAATRGAVHPHRQGPGAPGRAPGGLGCPRWPGARPLRGRTDHHHGQRDLGCRRHRPHRPTARCRRCRPGCGNHMLIGEPADPTDVDAIAAALVGHGVHKIIHLKTMHLAPEELLVAAKIAVSEDASGEDITEAPSAASSPPPSTMNRP